MSKSFIRQHQPLRVPNGWKDQERSLVIQLERLFEELFTLTSRHEDVMVTGITYDTSTHKLTVTINGTDYDVIGLSSQTADGFMSDSDKAKLDGVEDHANNYSLPLAASGTRGGVQIGYTESGKKYALQLDSEKGFVEVPWTDTLNTAGVWDRMDKKLYLVASETQGSAAATNTNRKVYIGSDNCLYSNDAKVLTSHQDISGKADKVSGATTGNFAGLDASGNLTDSGHKHSDYITSHQDISGKADKVSGATNNNFAALDSSGNLKDSGHKHSDYLTSHQDISGKADKVSGATAGNFASLDASGNLTDSGHKHGDYLPTGGVTWGALAGQ